MRVVAATNRVLRDEVAAGRFREDLFFRLNVIPMQLAPLRERREDVLPLARHFLARHAAERRAPARALGPRPRRRCSAHPWPGNVRELENAIERAVVLARGEHDHAGGPAARASRPARRPRPAAARCRTRSTRATAARIRAALDAAHGNRAEAARALGIDRTTLYRLMKRLGMEDR